MVEKKIDEEIKAMQESQSAANLETKSSAGDKYETGRAMMQIEKEKHSYQLEANQKIKQILSNINVDKEYTQVFPGSLLSTNQGVFFVAVSLGLIELDGISCQTISLSSPLGKVLAHKKLNEEFDFRGKTFKIENLI